ncbi:MAG: thiolase C-terminal domain-containing protein [Nitrososphaerales archaeon]
MSSMNKRHPLCSVISAGCAKYGKREGLSAAELFNEALDELFSSCPRLEKKDVKALYLGQAFESFEHRANVAGGFANNFGLANIPAVRVESVSSSGGSSLRQGVIGILSGQYDLLICAGVEKMTTKETPEALEIISMASDRPFEQWNGATLTALNALAAREHMRKYGTTEEQLAMVSVKNHRNALLNPKAYLHKAVTVEEVLASRNICSPLKLLDCSPVCDGASAVALCSPEIARKFTDAPVDIMGSGEASDTDFVYRDDLTSFPATKIALKKTLEASGMSIDEMDLLEVHDAFTINEIIAYEDLGLCEKGQGGKLAERGATNLDGEFPVNTSGGLKAKGHPIGSSGTGQAYEVYQQLTGRASPGRQIKGAKTALTHSMGGAGVTVQVHAFRAG